MLNFISSMNYVLYKKYGEIFLNSWRKFAGKSIKLIIFFEGDNIIEVINNFQSDSINIVDIYSNEYNAFREIYTNFSEARGIKFLINQNKEIKAKYDYRYDAIRFSFKIFSIYKAIHELNLINNIIWIDSDVVCKTAFSIEDLYQFIPQNNEIASYLGRKSYPKPNPYSECGFVGYNLNNKSTLNFIEEFYNCYISGEIFTVKEWHDSYIFDFFRIKYERKGESFLNLSHNNTNEDHPFMYTNLGIYFDHLKGPLKNREK